MEVEGGADQTVDLKFTWADPGFLERGFICIKGWGFTLLNYLIFLNTL